MASQNFSATGGETDCKTKFYQERFLTGAYERQEPVGPRAMRVSKKLPGTSQQRTLFPKKHLNMAPVPKPAQGLTSFGPSPIGSVELPSVISLT